MSSSTEYVQSKQIIGYPVQAIDHASNTFIGYPASPPPNTNPNPSHPTFYKRNLRRLIIGLFASIFILIIISLIMWIVLRPQLPEFRVASASIPPLDASNHTSLPQWEVNFTVNNPNKEMSVLYEGADIMLYYKEDGLCDGVIAEFDQKKKTDMNLSAKFKELDDNILNLFILDQKLGMVSLDVEILSWIQFQYGVWTTKLQLMRVTCMDVRIGFSSTSGVGTYLGGSENCKVIAD